MQAFIITAYKNQKQLVKLVQTLNKNALVFVHIDKKSTEISLTELKALHLENTIFISKYNIPWGGYTHLLAILELIRMALKDSRVEYIHTLSAQDILICPFQQLEDFFQNSDKIYMTCSDSNTFSKYVCQRFQQHIITSRGTSPRLRKIVEKMNKKYIKLQKKLHICYSTIKPFNQIYKGMIWCSMPRQAAEYALYKCKKTHSFLHHLKHISLPEEFFFQTIFMNSPFRNNIVTNNLRYTVWIRRHNSNPAILDESDYDNIINSHCIFARKIDFQISNELIKKLDTHIE